MTKNENQLQELIQADLDGELSVTERAELARLLLQDPEARRLQNDFRRTDQLLREIAADTSAAVSHCREHAKRRDVMRRSLAAYWQPDYFTT